LSQPEAGIFAHPVRNASARSPEVVATSHDHLFQLVFADPQHAVPLLRSALPAAIAATIDWSTLTRERATQRGRRRRKTICDVLFSARSKNDQKLYLYVDLEHKARSTRFDALQVLEQVVGVLRTHRREHPHDRYLPLVIPVVIHADHRPWLSPLDVRELFDLARIPAELRFLLPSCRYLLDDLHQQDPQQLRQRALTVFGLCTLSTLQYLPPAARSERAFAAWLDAWGDVQRDAALLAEGVTGRDLYDAVVDYVLSTSGLPVQVVQRLLTRQLSNPVMKKKFLSTAQQIRNEGRAAGVAEGKAEGKAEGLTKGKVEGQASTLLRQITRRFGAPDAAVIERIRAASMDELDRLADRILDAATLDELLVELLRD
jgi:predicted transposase YdaD